MRQGSIEGWAGELGTSGDDDAPAVNREDVVEEEGPGGGGEEGGEEAVESEEGGERTVTDAAIDPIQHRENRSRVCRIALGFS